MPIKGLVVATHKTWKAQKCFTTSSVAGRTNEWLYRTVWGETSDVYPPFQQQTDRPCFSASVVAITRGQIRYRIGYLYEHNKRALSLAAFRAVGLGVSSHLSKSSRGQQLQRRNTALCFGFRVSFGRCYYGNLIFYTSNHLRSLSQPGIIFLPPFFNNLFYIVKRWMRFIHFVFGFQLRKTWCWCLYCEHKGEQQYTWCQYTTLTSH